MSTSGVRATLLALLSCLLSAGLGFAMSTDQATAPTREATTDVIVSTCLPADETLLALLEDRDRIAALSIFASDEEISHVTQEAASVSRRVRGRAEEILALEPSLVLTFPFAAVETRTLLSRTGVPLVDLPYASSVEQIASNVRLVGRAVDRRERADELVAEMHRALAELAGAARDRRVLVYNRSGTTYGADTLVDEMVRWVGAQNVARERSLVGHATIGIPALLELDPDVVLVVDYDADGASREVGGRAPPALDPALRSLRAVEAGDVQSLSARNALTSSHHVVALASELVERLGRRP